MSNDQSMPSSQHSQTFSGLSKGIPCSVFSNFPEYSHPTWHENIAEQKCEPDKPCMLLSIFIRSIKICLSSLILPDQHFHLHIPYLAAVEKSKTKNKKKKKTSKDGVRNIKFIKAVVYPCTPVAVYKNCSIPMFLFSIGNENEQITLA